jgi:cell division protein FtsQ
VPRVGNQRILLGNADSLATKFSNLKIFYKQALPLVGWDAYKLINIKYINQVVGVRNETLLDSIKRRKVFMADSIKRAEIKQDTAKAGAMPVLEDTKEKTSIKN